MYVIVLWVMLYPLVFIVYIFNFVIPAIYLICILLTAVRLICIKQHHAKCYGPPSIHRYLSVDNQTSYFIILSSAAFPSMIFYCILQPYYFAAIFSCTFSQNVFAQHTCDHQKWYLMKVLIIYLFSIWVCFSLLWLGDDDVTSYCHGALTDQQFCSSAIFG